MTDTGQGMSPTFLQTKVFTAFSQDNHKAAGSGLGLSIVKTLVNQLGGDIDIKSILNIGTIVTITIRKSFGLQGTYKY
jgi:signal transduction histidine kinase